MYWFLKENISGWIFRALAFLRRNASLNSWCISHVFGSECIPCGSRFEGSAGVSLSPSYTSDWVFSKSRYLAILSDSIKPWPMTLAPTNEAIRREIMQNKTCRLKRPLWFGSIIVGCMDIFYQFSLRLVRVGDDYYLFYSIHLQRVLLSGYEVFPILFHIESW